MKFLLLCFLLAAGICVADVSRNDHFSSFYNTLPDDLKYPFIKYELALAVVKESESCKSHDHFTDDLLTPEGLGVPEETFHVLQELDPPHGFSGRLYGLVTERLELSTDEVIELITKGVICQNGYCYDLGDVGSNCC